MFQYCILVFCIFQVVKLQDEFVAVGGEIFTKAGETFHKLADMTALLDTKQIKVQVPEYTKTRNVSE